MHESTKRAGNKVWQLANKPKPTSKPKSIPKASSVAKPTPAPKPTPVKPQQDCAGQKNNGSNNGAKTRYPEVFLLQTSRTSVW